MFRKIAILGSGLMGGSLALALKSKAPQTTAFLWARKSASADKAIQLGIQASTDLAAVVKDADLLVLTTPVGAMAELLQQAITAGLPSSAVITDVGSVKKLPHDTLEPIAGERLFIGSHPMVGSEKSGLGAIDKNLYQGGACLMTKHSQLNIAPSITQAIMEFWQIAGCSKITWLGIEEHDALVAKISHFPHMMASIVSTISAENYQDASFSGQGLKDTSRVASGDASMWAEIIQENHQAILPYLKQATNELDQLQRLLVEQDEQGLQTWLQQAKTNRDQLS